MSCLRMGGNVDMVHQKLRLREVWTSKGGSCSREVGVGGPSRVSFKGGVRVPRVTFKGGVDFKEREVGVGGPSRVRFKGGVQLPRVTFKGERVGNLL